MGPRLPLFFLSTPPAGTLRANNASIPSSELASVIRGGVLSVLFLLPLLLHAESVGADVETADWSALDVDGGPPTDGTPWWERTLLDADRDGIDDALAPLLALGEPLTVIVDYAEAPTRAQLDALAARATITWIPDHFPLVVVQAASADVPALATLPGVVLVEKNDDIFPLLAESVPLIGAPQAWTKYGATGQGVTVAVLDDGAFEQHPDFEGKIVASYNAAVTSTPFIGSGVDAPVTPAGGNGHGTHVAGTIVGQGDESGGRYRGVAPDARFVNVGVFSGPNRTSSDVVLRGLDWVLSNRDAHGIRVAQMSLGGRPSDGLDALSRGVDIAVDKGLIVVAAAGNAGPGDKTVSSPGAASKAVTVGAVDKQKRITSFSSRGPTLDGRTKPDLVAPGRDITSTVPPTTTSTVGGFVTGGGNLQGLYYGSLSGTSMAAPHVAGVVALMLEANPGLDPIMVKRMLLATAQDLGGAGADNETGYGFVNGIAAVQVASKPELLQRAEFRSVLATIPDPPAESFADRMQYEIERLDRAGLLPYVAIGALVAVILVMVGVVKLVRRR